MPTFGEVTLGDEAVCMHCGYSLRALAEPRCPECGNAFDPAAPSTYRMPGAPSAVRAFLSKHVAGVLLAAALLMMWAEAVVCAAGFVGVPLAVASFVVSALRGHWGKVALLSLLSQYVVWAALGVGQYLEGRPHIGLLSVHGAAARSIHPVYRCAQGWTGCSALAGNHRSEACHDAAVKLCITLFGYARGSYAGPYPTPEEAIQAISTGAVLPVDGNRPRTIACNDHVIPVRDIRHAPRLRDLPSCEITWAVYGETCLIVSGRLTHDPRPVQDIVLIDVTRATPFAWYLDVPVTPG